MNQQLPEECLGYCRVSTSQQDLSRQREQILTYANSNNLSLKSFIETKASADKRAARRSIDELYQQIETTGIKTVIVAELSRLGRSVGQLLKTVDELVQDLGCRLIVLQENFDFRPGKELDMSSEVALTLFSLLARIERCLISERTKAGLAARKAQGVKLGRPKGKSKLDQQREKIFELRVLGVPIRKCAEHLECQTSTMSGWLQRHKKEIEQWKNEKEKLNE
jgi:DNA invertase Pin-like site-specific DNA recombinase